MCNKKSYYIIILLLIILFLTFFTVILKNSNINSNTHDNIDIYTNDNNSSTLVLYTNNDTKSNAESNNKFKLKITILGAVHGNEPVGYHALTDMILNKEFDSHLKNEYLYIFPDPNKHGRLNNQRNSIWGDINRLWPNNIVYDYNILTYPIQTMLPHINNSNVIIDIHEAKGFNECRNTTLGNTIYISDESKKDFLIPIIDKLNKVSNEYNLINANKTIKGDVWKILYKLPKTKNTTGITLDEYINIIPIERRPLYILIEIPGQNDFQTLAKRTMVAKFLIHSILQYFDKPI